MTSPKSLEGFICPFCVVGFPTSSKLQQHWLEFHNVDENAGPLSPLSPLSSTEVRVRKKHQFRTKNFKKPQDCHVCRQIVWNKGSLCQVCDFACHAGCEHEVKQTCSEATVLGNDKQPHDILTTQPVKKSLPPPAPKGIMSSLKHIVAKGRDRYVDEEYDLDLTYITERVIAMSFPAKGFQAAYRNNIKEVASMLRDRHGENYMIINLSERRYDIGKFNNQVLDFGWPDHLAPPLERLCSICKSIDSWLNSDPQHVVVVHCKGGKGRTGVVIAAYMHYSNICSSADQALDYFAMKRFYDDKLAGVTQPSQRRYVHYFSGLLSGAIKINSNPLYLHHILIHGVPNYDGQARCRPFLKVYQGMQPIYTSGVYNLADNSQRICFSMKQGLQLRGDILVKCYHKKYGSSTRDVIFRCQFHTCAIADYGLVYSKTDLDDACIDPRFPNYSKVEFIFSPSPHKIHANEVMNEGAVSVDDSPDPLVRWDSYENFNNVADTDINENENGDHIQSTINVTHMSHKAGPVDGSLYATVGRKLPQNGPIMHNGPQSSPSHSTNSSGYGTSGTSFGVTSFTSSSPNVNISIETKNQGANTNAVSLPQAHVGSHMETRSATQQLVEEQSQLDDILNELLSDQTFTTPGKGTTSTMSEKKNYSTPDGEVGTISVKKTSYNYNEPGTHKKQHVTIEQYEKSGKTMTGSWNDSMRVRTPSPTLQMSPPRNRLHSVPYNPVQYETQPHSYRSYSTSDTAEDSSSWLHQQQQKLQARKERPHWEMRKTQEKQLVQELKNAQSQIARRRVSESEANPDYVNSVLSNGPSFDVPDSTLNRTYKSQKDIIVEQPVSYTVVITPQERQANFIPGETKYTMESHEQSFAKPPTPARSSSKDAMKSRTLNREWYSSHGRKISRQNSDTSYDRERPVVSYKVNKPVTTPPAASPRSFSPQNQSYHTVSHSSYNYQTQQQSEVPITPVHVDRTQAALVDRPPSPRKQQTNTNTTEYTKKLDDLEQRLQQATFNEQNQATQHTSYITETKVEAKPKRVLEDEEKISLQPVGIAQLEPERPPSRSTTPSFPLSPAAATPPFPVSPQTPYINQAATWRGRLNSSASSIGSHTPDSVFTPGPPSWNSWDREKSTTQFTTSQNNMQTGGGSFQQGGNPAGGAAFQQGGFHTGGASFQQGSGSLQRPTVLLNNQQQMNNGFTNNMMQNEVQTNSFEHSQMRQAENLSGRYSPSQISLASEMSGLTTASNYNYRYNQVHQQNSESNFAYGQTHVTGQNIPLGGRVNSQLSLQSDATVTRGYAPSDISASTMRSANPATNNMSTIERPTALQKYKQQERNIITNTTSEGLRYTPSMESSYDPSYASIPDTPELKAAWQNQGGDGQTMTKTEVRKVEQFQFQDGQSQPGGMHSLSPNYSAQQFMVQQPQNIQQQQQVHQQQQHKVVEQHHQYNTMQTNSQQGFQQQPQLQVQGNLQPQLQVQGQMQPQFIQADVHQLPQQSQQFHQQQQYNYQQQQQQQPVQYQQQNQQQQLQQNQQHQQNRQYYQTQHSDVMHNGTLPSGGHSGMSYQGGTMQHPQQSRMLHVETSNMVNSGGMQRSPSSGSPGMLSSPQFPQSQTSPVWGTLRHGSFSSSDGMETMHHTPKFVKDNSKYWYKPNISRDDTIQMLKDKSAGTFIVRDSNSFPGAFGLAVKVAQLPPNVQTKGGDLSAELVRHFLIEPTPKGVRLKGCSNEPVFGSLAALVYQHSITPLALPCRLVLPDTDTADGLVREGGKFTVDMPNSAAQLLHQGAACNVLYINTVDMESLTGPQAIAKAVQKTFNTEPPPKSTVVHFKVSSQGITLTDNNRRLFFRRHYAVNAVTFCGMDPEDRRWAKSDDPIVVNAKIFGFVARKQGSSTDNACHIFAEIDPDQPANAIVNFVTKVMISKK